MAYSNCCNGSCGCGNGCTRYNNNKWCRNSYAALNTVSSCSCCRNYPFYTGNCPNECGCYNCGCTAGVTNQNNRVNYGRHSCCHCGCMNNGNCNNHNGCGCGTGCCDNCGNNCKVCTDVCSTCGCDPCRCGGCEGFHNECCPVNGCDNCCTGNPCGCAHCPVYGMFTSNAPLSVTAGAAIPLTVTNSSTNDFTVSGGTVTINRCGTYLATYTVNIPTGAEVDTNIVMNVNGVAQPSTLLTISELGSYTGQTVFNANKGTAVSLVSSAAFAITEPVGQNVVAVTLTRIS